jgi:hypothetical protein
MIFEKSVLSARFHLKSNLWLKFYLSRSKGLGSALMISQVMNQALSILIYRLQCQIHMYSIHTNHALSPREMEASQIYRDTPIFNYYLAMTNIEDVIGGKPIAVWSQSILGVHLRSSLVAFYGIHGRKGEMLFCSGQCQMPYWILFIARDCTYILPTYIEH